MENCLTLKSPILLVTEWIIDQIWMLSGSIIKTRLKGYWVNLRGKIKEESFKWAYHCLYVNRS